MMSCKRLVSGGLGLRRNAVVCCFLFTICALSMLTLRRGPTTCEQAGSGRDGQGVPGTDGTAVRRFVSEESDPDDHADLKFMRTFGRTHGLPNETELNQMEQKQLAYTYHSYLDNIDYICRRKIRLGNLGDGGWELCDDYEFRPLRPCIVYSFGINYDFTFDDATKRLYFCDVFSFDPSMEMPSQLRKNRVRFIKVGLGGRRAVVPEFNAKRTKWTLKTLTDIKTMLGHSNSTIDVLKLDIEDSEWSALEDMMEKQELGNVRQLLIEFHAFFQHKTETWRSRLHVLRQLEALGFRRFYTHHNPLGDKVSKEHPVVRAPAYELSFVNTRFSRQRPL